MKSFIVLGSTGSIGKSSLDVIKANPEVFRAAALCADSSVELMCGQITEFKPEAVCMNNPEAAEKVREFAGSSVKVYGGPDGLGKMISAVEAENVINGLVGSAGMKPTITAMENGKDVLLANKETMVMAGKIVMESAKKYKSRIVPIDSEMSAIYQCLKGQSVKDLRRVILTASGGPFTDWPKDKLKNVTFEQALNHPTWNMGVKNTIDSATMMNKGLEIIEASFLFDIPGEKIDVAVHRTSVVHSFVEFMDGSLLCQLSKPDMRLAIQYSMTDPERLPSPYGGIDFTKPFTLGFEPPDFEKFPCLQIAYDVLKTGGTAPAAMNGANEEAVAAFSEGKIKFMDIPELIKKVIEKHDYMENPGIDNLIETDLVSKRVLRSLIS